MAATVPNLSAPPGNRQTPLTSFLTSAMALVWVIALGKLVFHIYFNNRYGYFIDEFDYMSCGDHPAWGYVDQPPLIPFLIHISRAVFGDSLRAVRFIPAVASSLLVVQSAVLAREFRGRRYAQLLTAICIAFVPKYLSNGSLLGTNCLEPNLWTGCAYFLILPSSATTFVIGCGSESSPASASKKSIPSLFLDSPLWSDFFSPSSAVLF